MAPTEPDHPPEFALDPLPEILGYRLRRAQAALFARFRERFADLDIRPALLGILTVIGNNPGIIQADVSETLGIAAANLVPLLGDLERRSLIERGPAPGDRRSRALTLTAAGADMLAECRRRENTLETDIASGLGDAARRELLSLLSRVELICRDLPHPLIPTSPLDKPPDNIPTCPHDVHHP